MQSSRAAEDCISAQTTGGGSFWSSNLWRVQHFQWDEQAYVHFVLPSKSRLDQVPLSFVNSRMGGRTVCCEEKPEDTLYQTDRTCAQKDEKNYTRPIEPVHRKTRKTIPDR